MNSVPSPLHVESKKQNETKVTKQEQSHRYREQSDGCHRGEKDEQNR